MEEGEEKEKKKKGERNCCGGVGFPWGWNCLAGCAMVRSCQVQLKADLRVSV
jgi:hypothetical protein